MRSKSNRHVFVTVRRSPQSTHDRSRKDAQQKQSSVVRYSQAITAKCSRQKPQGCAVKAIVSCWLKSSDHRKVLTTESARMRSKSNRQLFVTVMRSPRSTHDRSCKNAHEKQSSVDRYRQAITAKYSRQKPQECAAKAIVSSWLQPSDHRKLLSTKAARMRSKSNRQLFVTVRRSLQSTHDRSRKDAQQKQSPVVGYSLMITAKCSRQKPQECAAKAIVSSWLQSSDHRKLLSTEAARMRSKSNRQLFVTVRRSLQSTHDRSRKDAQQKQSSVVGYSLMITAKCSRQKPQGCAGKAIVSCWLESSDHRKVLTTEAARMRSKSNPQLVVTVRQSPQSTHDRSCKNAQVKQSSVVGYSQAITAKYSRQKPEGYAANASVRCSLQSGDHCKVLTTEAARMRSKSNRQLLVTVKRSPQSTHDRSRKDAQQKQASVVRYSQAITAKYSRQKPQGCAAKAIVSCWLQSSDHHKVLTTEAARMRSKSKRQLFVTVRRSPLSTHDRSRKDTQQKQSSVVRYSEAITAKYSRQKPQGCAAKAIVSCW